MSSKHIFGLLVVGMTCKLNQEGVAPRFLLQLIEILPTVVKNFAKSWLPSWFRFGTNAQKLI